MFESYIARLKYGFSLTLESTKFTVRNADISFLYLLGLFVGLLPAAAATAVFYLIGGILGLNIISTTGYVIGSIIYLFTTFYVRGTIIHITGARMLGEKVSLIEGIKDVLGRPGVFLKWAVITAIVQTLFKLARNNDSDNIIGVIINYVARAARAIWQAATYFILPTIIFYSETDTKEQALQSVDVLRKRYVEIAAVKVTTTLIFIFVLLLALGATLAVVALSVFSQSLGFFVVALFALGGAFFLTYLLAIFLNDVTRTALYLESEAPNKVKNFNTNLFGAEIPNKETLRKDFINNIVEEKLSGWKKDGEFKHRL